MRRMFGLKFQCLAEACPPGVPVNKGLTGWQIFEYMQVSEYVFRDGLLKPLSIAGFSDRKNVSYN